MSFVVLHFFVAFVFALFISVVFTSAFRKIKLWINFRMFFLMIFLFTWAGGIWLVSFGPTFRGIALLPFLFASVLAATLMSVALSAFFLTRRRQKEAEIEFSTFEKRLDAFYWTMVVYLIIAIFVRYFV
jgi:hypothetical protein